MEEVDEITINRRVALFNVKARGLQTNNIFGYNDKKRKDLLIEREKLIAVLTKHIGLTDAEKLLEKIKKEE